MRAEPIEARMREVARELVGRMESGRLLDVGTGPGGLLLECHRLNPRIEMYGLDISNAMIERARRNLRGVRVDLRQGSIRRTDYETGFFDLIACVGSFYLWDYPEESLEETWRILKDGGCAYLFEVYSDADREQFRQALRANLRQLDSVRRLFGPLALRKALNMAYSTEDVARIVERTSFAGSHAIEKIDLSGLPIWLRITLRKGGAN
jgi:ubiquinone/menaquinone biosynthesis C-methylase UbiE